MKTVKRKTESKQRYTINDDRKGTERNIDFIQEDGLTHVELQNTDRQK